MQECLDRAHWAGISKVSRIDGDISYVAFSPSSAGVRAWSGSMLEYEEPRDPAGFAAAASRGWCLRSGEKIRTKSWICEKSVLCGR